MIRAAECADLPSVAEVFVEAFPESVAHLSGCRRPLDAVQFLFSVVLAADRESLLVWEDTGQIVGYICAPLTTQGWWRPAAAQLARAPWARMVRTRQVTLFGLWRAAGDKARFLLSAKSDVPVRPRILSLAVRPAAQGRGIGRQLLSSGIASLQERGAERVRLEVRPDNAAALALYQSVGFQEAGRTRDSQGSWLIMVKELE